MIKKIIGFLMLTTIMLVVTSPYTKAMKARKKIKYPVKKKVQELCVLCSTEENPVKVRIRLHCKHAFCKTCLVTIYAQSIAHNEQCYEQHKKVTACPLCKANIFASTRGADLRLRLERHDLFKRCLQEARTSKTQDKKKQIQDDRQVIATQNREEEGLQVQLELLHQKPDTNPLEQLPGESDEDYAQRLNEIYNGSKPIPTPAPDTGQDEGDEYSEHSSNYEDTGTETSSQHDPEG